MDRQGVHADHSFRHLQECPDGQSVIVPDDRKSVEYIAGGSAGVGARGSVLDVWVDDLGERESGEREREKLVKRHKTENLFETFQFTHTLIITFSLPGAALAALGPIILTSGMQTLE